MVLDVSFVSDNAAVSVVSSNVTVSYAADAESVLSVSEVSGLTEAPTVTEVITLQTNEGAAGRDATSSLVIDPQTGNRASLTPGGLYIPPISVGDLTDMTLIFENALV